MTARPNPEEVRDAVITIQGGGVYGLSLLGQLQEIIDTRKFIPLALAGTSAGAIISTLLWGKLTPKQIREKFVEQANRGGLTDLIGPFAMDDGTEFTFNDLVSLKDELKEIGPDNLSQLTFSQLFLHPIKSWKSVSKLLSLKRSLVQHWRTRGIFKGDVLEQFIESCLSEADDVKKFKGRESGEPLKFKHFRDIVDQNGPTSYRPPLFITVTNLTTRKVELINSIDDNYLNVPIAKAVRASAGFPVFFRPTEMHGATDNDCFVDGGVVSNFPAWIYAELFRKKIQKSEYFRWLASKAWVHIGLRVGGDPEHLHPLGNPADFFSALTAMLTGYSRNELESHLANMVPRSITIQQPYSKTDGPKGVLDIGTLSSDKVVAMVSRGQEFAAETLKNCPSSIVRFSNGKLVQNELEKLVKNCELILGKTHATAAKFRANVFVALKDRLQLMFSYGMGTEDSDKQFDLDFGAGSTGHCYTSRCPMLCNLQKIRDLVKSGQLEAKELFAMTKDQHDQVREDRTWLASVPIFDPFDSSLERKKVQIGAQSGAPHSYCLSSSPVDGGVIGVLNVDAAFNYADLHIEEDPLKHFTNPHVQVILECMQASAMRIGLLLAETFDSVQ